MGRLCLCSSCCFVLDHRNVHKSEVATTRPCGYEKAWAFPVSICREALIRERKLEPVRNCARQSAHGPQVVRENPRANPLPLCQPGNRGFAEMDSG